MTKFLDSLTELVDSDGNFYYVDQEGQHYRMVEEDEDFDFVDPDDSESAYIYVDENNRDGSEEEEIDVLVHRIVASTFLENPNNYLFVNHKDGNRSNNHVDNLEWVAEGGDQFLFDGMNLEGLGPDDLTRIEHDFEEDL